MFILMKKREAVLQLFEYLNIQIVEETGLEWQIPQCLKKRDVANVYTFKETKRDLDEQCFPDGRLHLRYKACEFSWSFCFCWSNKAMGKVLAMVCITLI